MKEQYYKPQNGNQFSKEELELLKEQYDEAVYEYYQTDNTCMSDLQFDELKDILEQNGYNLSTEDDVEPDSIREKLSSTNNMISLKKVQVFSESMEPKHVQAVINWLQQYNPSVTEDTLVAVGWKLDGCASSLRYNEDGELIDIVSRGNFSLAKKMLPVAKQQHPFGQPNSEIRCEMLLSKHDFIKRGYNETYANPRNLVAGISNDINPDDQRKWDVQFIRVNDGLNANEFDPCSENKYSLSYTTCKLSALPMVYNIYKEQRSRYEFPTDGLVVYLPGVTEFRHIGKYPLHSVAVKFPPVEAITTVKEIRWNLKKSGEWIPKAILEPVDLDGSTVKQTLIFNIGFMRKNKLYPGAEVVIAKNGDIIPYVQRVVKPGSEELLQLPEETIEVGIHLYPTSNTGVVARERFIAGCYCMGIKNFGYAWFRGLAELCNNDIVQLFNSNVINLQSVQQLFAGQKKPKQFIDALEKVKQSLTIYRVLRYLQLPKLGPSTARQMARYFSGLEYSTFGLEKSIVNNIMSGEGRQRINEAMHSILSFGLNIEMEKEETEQSFSATFEMTGSPKGFGFATKEAFCQQVSGWKHTKLDKTTTYLITDDKTSISGKMGKAKKLCTTILTYDEAIKLYNN